MKGGQRYREDGLFEAGPQWPASPRVLQMVQPREKFLSGLVGLGITSPRLLQSQRHGPRGAQVSSLHLSGPNSQPSTVTASDG